MLILAWALRDPLPAAGLATRAHWWAWSGGLFGAIYIAISILLLPRLGTATFVVLLVAGQMLASLITDHYGFFGVVQHPVSAPRLLGAALLLGGVILVRR